MTKPDLTRRPATTVAPLLAMKLCEIGKKLKKTRFSKEQLLEILEQAVMYLAEVDQSPSAPILTSLTTPMHALVMPKILRHHDNDVRILVATSIIEIMRITAPAVLYSDDILKEIFELIVATFRGLDDIHSPSFGRRVTILETVAKVRLCVIMLDLQCDDLILEIFYVFFSRAREDHPENVLTSMQTILTDVLNESEVISEQLSSILLSRLRRENGDISLAAYRLAMNVMRCVAIKLEKNVNLFLTSVMSAKRKSANDLCNYHEIIFNIYQCAPKILRSVIPNLTQELLSELSDVRLSAVKLLGSIIAIPSHELAKEFQPLLSEFLKRFTDNSVEVRLAAVKYAKECILSNPFRLESSGIIAALGDRLLDSDEAVRKQVIGAICDVVNDSPKPIPIKAIRQVADCLHDKMVSVQKYTLERLVEVYRVYCSKCLDGSVGNFEFVWIPGKILGCCYDKNFRSQVVDEAFSQSLFPSDLPLSERVKHWIAMFSEFEKPEIEAFKEVLKQKERLQAQMQNFLSLREKMKEEDTPELKNKILSCVKIMSGSFSDAPKAEESFIKLSTINDNNIWKALSSLLDSSLTFVQTQLTFDYLLKQLGDGHPQYEFVKILAMRCSYFLFGKEHVKEMLKEIAVNTLAGKDKIIVSSMNLLVLFARFFPSLFDGVVKDILQLLKDDNDYIKEGVVQILAETGTIHEKIIETNGPVDLLLENLCLEGSRKQAKYAVQAIVAIKKDFGPRALSVLYKRLVDTLESGEHLATVLQSLGCIAQTAVSVFETREDDIIQFICRKLLRRSSIPVDISKTGWDERSKVCFLKICGIKTLVRSYLPNRNAHLRRRIKALFGVLTKLITTGEISEEVQSSKVDKSQIRLAAAKAVLRLSRQWDCHINPHLFHMTLRTAQDICPHVRKQFLAKVHRYLKDGHLHQKYACAFVLSIGREYEHDFLEARQYLAEFFETCRDTQFHHSSLQLDCNSCTASPEIVLSYLLHSLAHHPDFPVSNKTLCAEAFEPFYRQLHFFLSLILHQDPGKIHYPENKNKLDSIPLIMTVFRTIKQMEDAVDKSKSKNLYALCDLGILITKDFAQSQINTGSESISISLPGLYCMAEGADLKEDGSHLPFCIGNDLMRRFKAAVLYSGAQLNPDQKCKRSACEKGPIEGENDVNEGHFSKRRLNKSNENTKESIYGRPTNPEIVIKQPDCGKDASNKSLVIGIIKADKGLDAVSLESGKPSEHLEEQFKGTVLKTVPSEVKSAEDNIISNFEKILVLSKRKRGRPSKRMGNLASQSNGQGLSVNDSNHLKLSRPRRVHKKYPACKQAVQTRRDYADLKLASGTQFQEIADEKLSNSSDKNRAKDGESLESEKPSEQHEEESKCRIVEVVPNEVKSTADNVMTTIAEASILPKRKQGSRYQNGPKDGQSLEFEKPSEKQEEQSKNRIEEVVPTEFKPAVDNVMMMVAEASVHPKRKRGRPYKDGLKDGETLEFEKLSELHEKQSKSRIKEMISNEVKSAVDCDNDVMTVGEVSVLLKRKRGRPFKNGSRDGESLEFERPSEQHEEQPQSTMVAVLNEVKPTTDNIIISVAESPVLPKRKRGRPSKGSVDLASQSNRQSLSGKDYDQLKLSRPKRRRTKFLGYKSDRILRSLSRAPGMCHNDQLIQRNNFSLQKQSKCLRKLDMQSSYKGKRERKMKNSDAVPRKTMVSKVNFTFTDKETLVSSKRRKRSLHKDSQEVPSPSQQQCLLEKSEVLRLSKCRGGCSKGSGKRSDSKEKLKLPDSTIMTMERVSGGFSGAELTPNCQPLDGNNASGEKVEKNSNKRLDDDHDELEKIIKRNLLGDQRLSTENEDLDAMSGIVCLHKKKAANPSESPEKVLNEDGNNCRETPKKLLRSKSFSGVEKKPANQPKPPEKGLDEDGKSYNGTPRKLLSKKFSGVEKSASRKRDKEIGEELVGHRIKVWWPLDKKFYVGIVESYDPEYRRHKVMYRDGDVEVLRLGREQWELIDGNTMSKKVTRTEVKCATSNGETSLYKTRSKTGLQNVNSNAHGVLKQRSNASSSQGEKHLSERTAGSLVSTDANTSLCSKGHRQENQGSEGRKVRRKTPLTKPIRRVLRSVKETKEKGNRSDYKRRGGLAVA